MITQLNSSLSKAAYQKMPEKVRGVKPNAAIETKDTGTVRVQKLKEAIDAGEYTIDLSVLAEKMAEDLL